MIIYSTIYGEASYRDFCELLTRKKFYSKLKGNIHSHDWIIAMSKAHYAEQPTKWKNLILSAIKYYKLDAKPVIPFRQLNELQPTDTATSFLHYRRIVDGINS